jgi:hypothetical protein
MAALARSSQVTNCFTARNRGHIKREKAGKGKKRQEKLLFKFLPENEVIN